MTEDQFQESVRFIQAGGSVREAAELIGTRRGVLSGHLHRRGLAPGNRPTALALTEEKIISAEQRHRDGETWDEIAKSMGSSRSRLCARVDELFGRKPTHSPDAKGFHYSTQIENHQYRKPKRIIKPWDEIKALLRANLDGEITTAEMCNRLGAEQ